MPRVGRNDPCPCGSGRKYKQCCQPKDQAAQVRHLSVRRDEELLWARLVGYAQRPAFFVDLRSAFSLFWNGDFDLEAASTLGREETESFLDWYVYDYRTTKDRRRIVDLFAAEEGPRMTPEQRALLAERQSAYLSLYGVESVQPDGRIEVGDLLAGGFFVIEDSGLARLAKPGDLLLGRRYGQEDGHMSRATALLPRALGADMVAAAQRAFGAYRDEHYQATWPEFLRESGYMLYHFLTTPTAAQDYAQAGHREGYYDPRAAVEGMHAVMRRRAEEAAKKAAEEARELEEEEALETGKPAQPPVERTAGGILIPGRPKPSGGSGGGILLPGDVR